MMNLRDLRELLSVVGIPVIRNEFTEPQAPPFLVYISDAPENTAADNIVWHSAPSFRLELYTTKKEGTLERLIEKILTDHEIYWEKDGDIKVDSESLWMTVYYI